MPHVRAAGPGPGARWCRRTRAGEGALAGVGFEKVDVARTPAGEGALAGVGFEKVDVARTPAGEGRYCESASAASAGNGSMGHVTFPASSSSGRVPLTR